LLYIHGGWWRAGSKEQAARTSWPYLEMGFSVINVEYRMTHTALAPAAVEDARCALRWLMRNARTYNFDTTRVVVMGNSAGGHLALMAAMLPADNDFDRRCPEGSEPKVAAIINYFGVTDVLDLLDGVNKRGGAIEWLGPQPNREDIARRASPLTYVRSGLPPIITVHGDADPTVPYQQAVRLHDALNRAKVPNLLVTIHGGKHGQFKTED